MGVRTQLSHPLNEPPGLDPRMLDAPRAGLKGSYILVLDLAEDVHLTVGRLGTFTFPAGLYLYCGSALNGLEARIHRHLSRDKKLHWHIDYLTKVATIVEVWWVVSEERLECRWAKAITKQGGEVVAGGFGSSDCRCATHLLRVADGDGAETIRSELLDKLAGTEQGVWKVGTMDTGFRQYDGLRQCMAVYDGS